MTTKDAQQAVNEANDLINKSIGTLNVTRDELQGYLDVIFYEESTQSTKPFKDAANKAYSEICRIRNVLKRLNGIQ